MAPLSVLTRCWSSEQWSHLMRFVQIRSFGGSSSFLSSSFFEVKRQADERQRTCRWPSMRTDCVGSRSVANWRYVLPHWAHCSAVTVCRVTWDIAASIIHCHCHCHCHIAVAIPLLLSLSFYYSFIYSHFLCIACSVASWVAACLLSKMRLLLSRLPVVWLPLLHCSSSLHSESPRWASCCLVYWSSVADQHLQQELQCVWMLFNVLVVCVCLQIWTSHLYQQHCLFKCFKGQSCKH